MSTQRFPKSAFFELRFFLYSAIKSFLENNILFLHAVFVVVAFTAIYSFCLFWAAFHQYISPSSEDKEKQSGASRAQAQDITDEAEDIVTLESPEPSSDVSSHTKRNIEEESQENILSGITQTSSGTRVIAGSKVIQGKDSWFQVLSVTPGDSPPVSRPRLDTSRLQRRIESAMAAAAAAKPKTQVDALISRREDFSVKLLPRVPTTLCQLPIDPLALKGLGLLPSNIPMPPLAPRGPSPLLVETLQSNHARRTISRRNSGSYFAPSLNSGPRFSSAAPLPVPSFWAPRPVPQQLMKPSGGQQNTSSEPPQPPPASSTFHPQVVARGSAAKLVARVFHPLPPRPQLPLPKSQLPPLSAGAPVKPPAPTVTLASSLKATAPAFVPSGKVTSPTISHSSPKRFVVHQDVQASLTSKAPTLQVAPQPPLTPIMESTNGPLLTISPLAFVNTNTAKTRAHTSGMPNWAMAPSAAVTKPMPPPNVQPQKSHTTEKPNWAIASIGEKRLVADENVLPPRPVAKWRGRVGGRFGG